MALANAPETLAPYEMMVEIHLSQGMRSKAGVILEQAARSKATDPYFWLSLAELTGRLSQAATGNAATSESGEKMAAFIEKAVGFSADNPGALARAGDLFVISREIGKAKEAYDQAYHLKASLPQLRQKLAACLVELGQSAEAIKILEEIVKLNPLDLQAYDELSKLHLRDGNLVKAAASARQALLIEPQILDRHIFAVDLLFRTKDFNAAASTLAEARKLFPSNPRLSYFYAMALSQSKQHEEAMAAFEQAAAEAANVQPEMLNADFGRGGFPFLPQVFDCLTQFAIFFQQLRVLEVHNTDESHHFFSSSIFVLLQFQFQDDGVERLEIGREAHVVVVKYV